MRSRNESMRRKRRGSLQAASTNPESGLFYLKQSLPQRYQCKCSLCQAQPQKFFAKQQHFDPSQLPQKIPTENAQKLQSENCYAFILTPLLEAANMKRNLGICVPDTVLFEAGVPHCIVISPYKEEYFKVIRQKEKLTFLEIRKFLDQRRKKYATEARIVRLDKTNASYQTNNPEAPFFRMESSGISFKDSLKSKLQNYTSLKTNRDSQLQQPIQSFPTKDKQFCLVNFVDNSSQIMNHLQYNFLFQRRKIDPYWMTVSSIQNFVKTSGSYQYKRVQFSSKRITDEGLYERARRQVKIIVEDYQRDQFTFWEDEQAFRNQLRLTESKYLLYAVYRIVHFLKQAAGIVLWKGSFFFLRDVLSNYYFANATNIHFNKINKSTQIVETKEEILHEVYEGGIKIMYQDQQRQVVSKICRDLLANAIELRKIQLQLSDYTKPPQQTINIIFNLFHPNFQSKLQRTMQSINWKRDVEDLIDQVRQRTQYLIHHSEGLKILHLHGIFFTKTLQNAKPITRRSFSAKLGDRRMSAPLFSNNFKVFRK